LKNVEETAALELLRQTGVDVTWNQIIIAFTNTLRQMVVTQTASNSHSDLTTSEAAALQEAGFDLGTDAYGLDDAVTRTAIEYATLIATSLSVPKVAHMLGVDDSRIRQRLAARMLYGLKVEHAWRLPVFQFEGNRVIPGVDKIFPRLRPDVHPIAVYTWFTSPDPDLVVERSNATETDDETARPMSPRDWLRSGGNAEIVAELAASL
jgi:hypothetical protein